MSDREIIIEECKGDYEASARVIREAFLTVAEEFNITRENAPSNGAFIEADALEMLADKGVKLFNVYEDGALAGFFALEDAGEGVYYLEKLSVIPEKRHNGIGKTIMDYSQEYVKRHSGKKISIAIIDENAVLKRWYIDYGFAEVRLKTFEHLPFTVCFMELPL
jgi:ribosomal protein S18 acetylase RimI-like enzyme